MMFGHWRAKYEQEKETNEKLKAWISEVCQLIPQLKVRSDRGLAVKARLDALAQEWLAQEEESKRG